jgi:hypothetical protein
MQLKIEAIKLYNLSNYHNHIIQRRALPRPIKCITNLSYTHYHHHDQPQET